MKIKILIPNLLTRALFTAGDAPTLDKAKLDQFFDRLAEKNKAMGSLAIAKDGKVLYPRAIGYSQINGTENKSLSAASRFRIGSIKKMFAAVAMLTFGLLHAFGQSPTPPDLFAGAKAGDETNVVGIKLCWCPPGTFIMGSPRSEPERRPGEDQIKVTLTKGFWMAKFEATQGDWKRVMGKLPGPLTAELPEGDDYPVGNVNFAETEAFCQKLTELARQSGALPKDWEFRLPTEAQWEYACRAGTTTATSFGDTLNSRQANFKGKPYNGGEPGPSLGRAAKVGGYPANPWGLHDMHGNIYEWCRDWYHSTLPGGVDPDLHLASTTAELNRTGDKSRSRRGGAWTDDGWHLRTAFRLRFEPHRRYDHIGFRVVVVRP